MGFWTWYCDFPLFQLDLWLYPVRGGFKTSEQGETHLFHQIYHLLKRSSIIIVNIFTYDNSYRKRGRGFKNVDNFHNIFKTWNDFDGQT